MDGTIFQTISDWLVKYIPIITSFVGSFAILAAATPNKTDDKIVQWMLDIVNFFGANFGNARNVTDKLKKTEE